jgi:hypothetical protein
MELRALHMLGKCSATMPYSHHGGYFSDEKVFLKYAD